MQPVSTVFFFFLQTAVSTPLPSNILTDDILALYEGVIRDNLAVSDLSKVIPWMMILRFEHSILRIRVEQRNHSTTAAFRRT